MYRTGLWTLWERERVGRLGEWHWNMWNVMYETRCQSRFNARCWMLRAGALGRPRGMIWGGRREEGSGWGTHEKKIIIIPISFTIKYQNVKKKKNYTLKKNKIKAKKKTSKPSWVSEEGPGPRKLHSKELPLWFWWFFWFGYHWDLWKTERCSKEALPHPTSLPVHLKFYHHDISTHRHLFVLTILH